MATVSLKYYAHGSLSEYLRYLELWGRAKDGRSIEIGPITVDDETRQRVAIREAGVEAGMQCTMQEWREEAQWVRLRLAMLPVEVILQQRGQAR